MNYYSLITGASKGLGRAIANELARRGRNIILVALPGEHLPQAATKIAEDYHVDVRFYEVDLTQEHSISMLHNWCQSKGLHVDLLVNNAGMGMQGAFCSSKHYEYLKLMQINMEVLVGMTAEFLPMLKESPRAYILNMGSIASFMQIPYKQVYAASKNFVLAYSNALHFEMKKYNIGVTCLCPGPAITNRKVALRVREQGIKGRLVTLSAQKVARYGISGLQKGKRVVIPGWINKLVVGLFRVLPTTWSMKLSAQIFNKSEEVKSTIDLEPSDRQAG